MKCSLLVLDCDGVILDSVAIKSDAMRRIGEPFGPELRDRLVMFNRIEGGISRQEKFRWLYREAYGREITNQEMEDMLARHRSFLGDSVLTCPLLPGVEQLLATWCTIVPICVCSGTPQAELTKIMQMRNLAHFFACIGGYPPAKSELLAQLIRQAGVEPADTVMVGDTVTDSRAAEENATQFFGIGPDFAGSSWPNGPDVRYLDTWLRDTYPDMLGQK